MMEASRLRAAETISASDFSKCGRYQLTWDGFFVS